MTRGGARVRLIHWDAGEAAERAGRLRAEGHQVDHRPLTPATLRALKADPPGAVVIDLSRLPMQGRDVGLALRSAAATRRVPLVFVEGEAAKVARVRRTLPDAAYATWARIGPALRRALARPPADPVVPASALAGYSGTPLPKKLGIKPASVVLLSRAPAGFERLLGDPPAGTRVTRRAAGRRDLTLWFVRSLAELKRGVAPAARALGDGRIWIVWPKRTSPLAGDVTETDVRREGLAAGLVDYKICAVDADWSGLLFTRRRGKA